MGRTRQTQAATRTRRRERKNIPRGRAFVTSTFNNTIVTITDPNGNVIAWGSGGVVGFKGSRKSTPYAAQLSAEKAAQVAMENGMREVEVSVKGPGPGREAAVRALSASGLRGSAIRDAPPIPHNGCRAAKCAVLRRPSPPGPRALRRRKVSDRGLQLIEKQKVRFAYGVIESQFRGYYERASHRAGVTGTNL